MKAFVVVTAAVAAGTLGLLLISPRDQGSREAHESHESHKSHEPPTTTITDFTEVFQRAFWKRPAADDRILHAERREWSDTAGVKRWQWFIAVEPSSQLVKYLRDDNAFSLTPAAVVPEMVEAPAWFAYRAADVDVLQAPHGNMRLLFSKSKRLLLATDSGGGFHPGVPEPVKPAAGSPSPGQATTGRLPVTSPPTSPKP